MPDRRISRAAVLLACLLTAGASAADKARKGPSPGFARRTSTKRKGAELTFPPTLAGTKQLVTFRSATLLKAPETLLGDVEVAKTPPTVELMYYPGQDYPGNPWSVWGDGVVAAGKYYSAIGDHLAPGGNAFVYEYDPKSKTLRRIVDLRQLLKLPEGHYTPGKIHSRIDVGSDGRLYFATHRGSTRVTTDRYHYRGDWIIAYDPKAGRSEIVAHGPVPKHCIPAGVLDPQRLIFYGGTAPGRADDPRGIQFFAFGVRDRKLLYSGPDGPSRYLMFSTSTGRVYYTPGNEGKSLGPIMRFDPDSPEAPVKLKCRIGLRAATQETPQGLIYAVSTGQGGREAILYSFDPKTEKVRTLGPAAVGTQQYITSIDADPTGRYLYYVPGAHGGSQQDGSPVVQFDVRTRRKKVIAFLHPYCLERFGCTLKGTFCSAVDPQGDKLYITWNNSRGGRVWDTCLLTVVHIPESERK